MLRSYTSPPAQRLMVPILLPLSPLRQIARQTLREMHQGHLPVRLLAEQTEELTKALLDQWFIDPEGGKLSEFISRSCEYPILVESLIVELQNAFHRLIRDTIGTLVPSLRYRFEIEEDGETLRIVPTLPTLDDHAERLHALADPETGWVPTRYR